MTAPGSAADAAARAAASLDEEDCDVNPFLAASPAPSRRQAAFPPPPADPKGYAAQVSVKIPASSLSTVTNEALTNAVRTRTLAALPASEAAAAVFVAVAAVPSLWPCARLRPWSQCGRHLCCPHYSRCPILVLPSSLFCQFLFIRFFLIVIHFFLFPF